MKTEKKIKTQDVKKGHKIIVTRFKMYCEAIDNQAFYIKYDKRCKNKELIEVMDVRQAKSSRGNHKMITSQNNENFYFYYSDDSKFLLA